MKKQFLRLHARTDDFVTTVGKARQYMDAQKQAKISAISKKPNVRFAATEDPPPDRIQPILDGLQKVLQTVLDNQNRSSEANVGEKVPGNGGPKKAKGKGNMAQSSNSEASTSTANQDFRYREQEPRGRPNEAPPVRARDDKQLPRWIEGCQGNQFNRSSSADSQFRQPLQDRDQQARGPRWNTGIPPGTADTRPRGQENAPFRRGCYVCGRTDCHSMFHRNDRTPPSTSRNQTAPQAMSNRPLEPTLPQRVRDTFIPWQDYSGCFQCGRLDCIARLHRQYGEESRRREDVPSTSTAPAGSSNLLRGSSQGERTPPNPPRPRND